MALCFTASSAVHVWEFVHDFPAAIFSSISHLFSVTVSEQWRVMARYTLEQCVFLYDSYVKYGSAGKCRQKFCDERVPSSKQFIIW
jgi:hypothetical protein